MPPPPPSPYGGGYPQQPYAPQPYAPQVTYGGFWIRLVALIIDGLIVAIPTIIVAIVIGVIVGVGTAASNANSETTNAAANGVSGLVQLIAILIQAAYFIYFWSTGQTLGMRLFRLRVVDVNTGQTIGLGKSALRFVGFYVSQLVCYIGLIWAAFDSRKQGWHDKIAGTVVLQG